MGIVHDQMLYFDWAKGQSGSGQFDYGKAAYSFEAFTGELAESWKVPEIGVWVLQIRRGVRFALNPNSEASRLANGRELTADDIVWNVRRYNNAPGWIQSSTLRSRPRIATTTTIEKTGPWEVTIKTPVDPWNAFFWTVWGGCAHMVFAPEVVEKYGPAPNGITDWRHMVGTGSFMLTDYVTQSVGTFKKNPNYYKKDPVGPGKGNQVPYVDTLKIFNIPDVSTRMATVRTGKGDWVSVVPQEDALSLLRTKPDLKFKNYIPGSDVVAMRVDKPELPFKDIKVRHALMMATNFDAIKNDLYRGNAEIESFPVIPDYTDLFLPMKDNPASVQALYKYNPERSKQLLAEAGYPNGFKTKMIVENIALAMDEATVLKAMWAKIGVDVEIQPRETAVYDSILLGTQEELRLTRGSHATLLTSILDLPPARTPSANIKDDHTEDVYQEMQRNVFVNMPKVYDLYRQYVPYIREKAWVIPMPSPYSYTIWQPWVKNHYGEQGNFNFFPLWFPYVWIDQDLKEQMTGRR